MGPGPQGIGSRPFILAKSLDPSIEASPLVPAKEITLRDGNGITLARRLFDGKIVPGRERFLQEIRAWLGQVSGVETAEFEITGIEEIASVPPSVRPAVRLDIRYDIVTKRKDERREERVGSWRTEWSRDAAEGWKARRWEASEETLSVTHGPMFVDITSQTLGRAESYTNQLLRGSDYWRTVLDGACGIDVYGNNGVAAGDFDNDGFDDLYVCQPSGLPNRLYRNRGDGTLEDVTEKSGVGVLDNTACALFADFENKGRQDLLVVCGSGPLLFLNQGNGTFSIKRDAFKFERPPQGTFTHAAVADYDLHAWAEVYIPGAGWIGFDATSGLLCGEGHLPLAASPHYRSARADHRRGQPGGDRLRVRDDTSRGWSTPSASPSRSRTPTGTALDALGEQVEADLQAQDVRLTMGGEPTFVSIDDFEAAEWNTDASGPTKPAIADASDRAPACRVSAHGGLLHYGQGKWYPGEPLPRWALGLYWRRDGKPIWRGARPDRRRRQAATAPPTPLALIAAAGAAAGRRSGAASCRRARTRCTGSRPRATCRPNVELDRRRRSTTQASRDGLRRAMERRALASRSATSCRCAGRWRKAEGEGWLSEAWRVPARAGSTCVPGDSPVGLRLPLGGLPEVKPEDYPYIIPLDPYEERGPLPDLRRGLPRQTPRPRPKRAAGRGKPPIGAHRPLASSRATGRSTSSCRRSRGWRTIWSWSRTSRRRPKACRSGSRAIRRRTTRGWRS